MNSTTHDPGPPSPLAPLHRHAVATGVGAAVVATALAVREVLQVMFDLKGELNRMADEWEDARPEQAARLREAARKGWDW